MLSRRRKMTFKNGGINQALFPAGTTRFVVQLKEVRIFNSTKTNVSNGSFTLGLRGAGSERNNNISKIIRVQI